MKTTLKKDSLEFNNFINKFIEDFKKGFGEESIEKYGINNLIEYNVKKLIKYDGRSFKSLGTNCSGLYNGISKNLKYAKESDENTIYHELFHALSNESSKKRETFLKFFLSRYFNKKLDVRNFEEGMTEYLANQLGDEIHRNVRWAYPHQTKIIDKICKIYGKDKLLAYYLYNDETLEEEMNKTELDSLKKCILLCQEVSNNELVVNESLFQDTVIYDKNNNKNEDDLLFRLFKKEKLKEIHDIGNFKYNLDQLFDYYESDIFTVAYEIKSSLKRLTVNNKDSIKRYIQKSIKKLDKFDAILKNEWNKLNINDNNLYYKIFYDKLKSFNEFASPIILDYLDIWNINLYKEHLKEKKDELILEKEQMIQNNNSIKENDDVNISKKR